MRVAILWFSVLFAVAIAAATGIDIARHGLTPVSLAAVAVAFIFVTALVGALTDRGKQ